MILILKGVEEMQDKKYSMGIKDSSWKSGEAQTITFIDTHDCNLRRKYCYITHKSDGKHMDFEAAKKFIDYILTTDDIKYNNAVILEFNGGEPLIEDELVD
jgi:sulfatase maturation enzyme AslB (radical SAM superfamily)